MMTFTLGGRIVVGTLDVAAVVIHSVVYGFGAYWLGRWFSSSQRKRDRGA